MRKGKLKLNKKFLKQAAARDQEIDVQVFTG